MEAEHSSHEACDLGFIRPEHVWTVACWFLQEEWPDDKNPVQLGQRECFVDFVIVPEAMLATPNFLAWRQALLSYGLLLEGAVTRKGNIRFRPRGTQPVLVTRDTPDYMLVCQILASWAEAIEACADEFGEEFAEQMLRYQANLLASTLDLHGPGVTVC